MVMVTKLVVVINIDMVMHNGDDVYDNLIYDDVDDNDLLMMMIIMGMMINGDVMKGDGDDNESGDQWQWCW